MRGQTNVLFLVLLSLLTLVLLAGSYDAVKSGVVMADANADSLTHVGLMFLPALLVLGGLFWAIAFVPGVFSR